MVLKTSALSPAENKGEKDTGSLCLPTKKRRDHKVHIPQQRPAKHCGQLGTNGKRDIEGPHSSTSLKGKRPALHSLG